SKKINKKYILNNVNLNIEGTYGLIGPNGAGKTTLMRALTGLISVNSGEIILEDGEWNTCGNKKGALQKIGYLPQEFHMYSKVTIWDCLNHLAILKGVVNKTKREKLLEDLLKKVNLFNKKDLKIENLSGGMKKRVGIAQMLIGDPIVLIIDEPTAGLDIAERIRFRNLIRNLSVNKIIIITSHIIEDVEFLCTKIGIINEGKVIAEGSPKEISRAAQGKVWRKKVSSTEINTIFNSFNVIDARQADDNYYYVRILADEQPPNSVNISPKVIDGYLSIINQGVEV
ncbi:ATP-binding cassette domain-containing protein, partial [Priestia megaterium]|uniref:ATP-binding cassette domain-containing protein n=1 Tax=Priestia megaterium TaxID=1404 RepID=UPI002FFD9B8A